MKEIEELTTIEYGAIVMTVTAALVAIPVATIVFIAYVVIR